VDFDGERRTISKMWPHVAAQSIVMSAGPALYFHNLNFLLARVSGGLDDLLAAMPASLKEAWALTAREVEKAGKDISPFVLNKVFIADWSESRQRCVGAGYTQVSAAKGFEGELIEEGCAFHPYPTERAPQWLAKFKGLDFPDSVEKMYRFAQQQVAFIRDVIPGQQPGGRLIVAEIDREGIVIRQAGEL
jgi:hypothetical protein